MFNFPAVLIKGVNPFLLRDDFLDTLPAGSVNGTLASDGHNARTVTDTENKLSLAGGYLNFSGGKAAPAYGDPGMWYPPFVRRDGLLLVMSFVCPTDKLRVATLGFDTATAGNSDASALAINSGDVSFRVRDGTVSTGVLGTYIPNVPYRAAVLLKGSGAKVWVIGGNIYTSWTLLYDAGVNTAAKVYPCIINYNSDIRMTTFRVVLPQSQQPDLDRFFDQGYDFWLSVGDSKAAGSVDTSLSLGFPSRLDGLLHLANKKLWFEYIPRIAAGGRTMATTDTWLQANIAGLSNYPPRFININLGVNDVSALPAEAAWKASYTSVIEQLHAKWPRPTIYTTRVWRRNFLAECNSLATWMAAVEATHPYVLPGPDERVFLENGDNGITYTTDGYHPNAAGHAIEATQLKTTVGM